MYYKKTRIIATLGPTSNNAATINKLLKSGVNVFRLNFSHGDHETHSSTITLIRNESKKTGIEPAILADLQGPKIRTGNTIDNKPVHIATGSNVVIKSQPCICNESTLCIDYPNLAKEVKVGQSVIINDGAVHLQIKQIKPDNSIICNCISGGIYSSHKGVNFPNVNLSIPSLTTKDKKDLQFILQNDIQYIALSFVRKPSDITDLRKLIVKKRTDIKIIAKIEKPEAAARIDEILEVTDGIMVARGDLGVEASLSSVPLIQKELIAKANIKGKTVIVATQMLESMINSPVPTRAETTDVTNAILDGTDAIMLSGETASGSYPVEAVQMMTEIACKTEASGFVSHDIIDLCLKEKYPPHSICEAAIWASRDTGNIPICIFTLSGETALYLSKLRPVSPIFAFTPDPQVLKQMALMWNIQAFHLDFSKDVDTLYSKAESILLQKGLIKNKELLVFISGTTSKSGASDTLRIKRIGQ